MDERELLKAFIEYCRKQGYGSAFDQEAVIEHFLHVQKSDPYVICPRCGAMSYLGYEICTCLPIDSTPKP